MYLIDYHTHSELSPDSSALLTKNAAAAVAMGISELCVTDHFDLLTGEGDPMPRSALRWRSRVAQYEAVKAATAGKLTLKLGVELGSGQVDAAAAAEVLGHAELDFVIGSLHNTGKRFGGQDYYYGKYTSPAQCYDLLDGYFDDLNDLVRADCYDVLGHIIFLKRYMTSRDRQTVSFDGYLERIRSILKGAVAHGRGIEVNTWCGRTIEEWRPILALYREVGGELLTVSSDAHVPRDVGKGIREAYALIGEMGFRYVTTYEKRRPVQMKL